MKRVCYLSVEYLLGRSLINGLASLDGDLVQEAREALAELGYDLERVAHEENDPGLGNGGLGRLAACFLDSLATLQFPAVGYGIRYDYGIFTQVIDEDGRQREIASTWMRERSPWEIARDDARYVVRFGGRCTAQQDAQGRTRYRWVDTHNIWAVGFDQLIPGNRSPTVNHLRLWAGRAIAPFNVETFNAGRHAEASAEQVDAKNVSRILYPDDTTPQGKELRFKQQYFFVSASLQDMLAQHLAEGRTFDALPDAISIQLNDTHPALAIPELIRLLVDEHEVDRGRRVEDHAQGVLVHQPHAAARGARSLAGRVLRAHPAAPPADHLPDQPRVPRRGVGALARRQRAPPPHVADRRRQRPPGPHGQPGGRRAATPSTAWRSCTPS